MCYFISPQSKYDQVARGVFLPGDVSKTEMVESFWYAIEFNPRYFLMLLRGPGYSLLKLDPEAANLSPSRLMCTFYSSKLQSFTKRKLGTLLSMTLFKPAGIYHHPARDKNKL